MFIVTVTFPVYGSRDELVGHRTVDALSMTYFRRDFTEAVAAKLNAECGAYGGDEYFSVREVRRDGTWLPRELKVAPVLDDGSDDIPF